MAEIKYMGTGQARRRAKTAKREGQIIKIKRKEPKGGKHVASKNALKGGRLRHDIVGERTTFWILVVETDESTVDVEREFTAAVHECVAAVQEAHEQMQNNREDIDRLAEETRRLLSKLKAA